MGKQINEAVEFFQDAILRAFESEAPQTIGFAAWAMGEVGFAPAIPFWENLGNREEPVRLYVKGHFKEMPLGHWANEAIGKIDEKSINAGRVLN